MDINFSENYKSLNTAELLNIVTHPDDYRPEAVRAAAYILKERNITDEDKIEANRILTDIKHHWTDESIYLNSATARIENFAAPIVNPETKVNIKHWINILMVVFGIYVIWSLINLVIRWQLLTETNHSENFKIFDIVQPLYLLFTIGGLYGRKKWGWALLMIYFIFETIAFAFGSYLSINYSFLKIHIAEDLLATFVYSGGVYLLTRHYTSSYFNISNRFIRNTIFSAILLFLLMQVYFKYFQ